VDDLVKSDRAEVAEYERGVSLREIAKGVLTRFLPAGLMSALGFVLVMVSGRPVLPLLTGLAGWVGWVGLGFGLGLLGLRKWLFPDAKVSGLRSVLAGVLAPLLAQVFLYLSAIFDIGFGAGSLEWSAILVLIGAVTALAMFFPWLTPTPPHMRGAGESPKALPEASK
jgi:hypothetical protein